jgi:DNA-directed RNA polymerase beta subunit
MPAEDMPVTMNGITPDIIINPTAIPSRMTIGKLIEVVASKYGALANERINGTSFRNFDLDELRENLRQYGYNVSGKERLISGKTGKMLSAEIFMGPSFYMAHRHHVLDKEQKRSTGAKTQLTHQPVGGRKHRGGQRVGEMERDALASHGASEVLRERLCTVSDAYEAVFCKECGTMSIVDFSDGRFECRTCEEADFGKCTIPYAFKLLSHLLAGAGVKISMDMKEEDIVVPADDRQPGMGRSSGKGKEDEEG